MDWVNTILVSVSMAADCMTVGAVDGIEEPKMRWQKALFIALVFGVMQGLMPVIGYFIGYGFADYIDAYIPWIAFGILTLLAIKNIVDWIKDRKEVKDEEKEEGKKPISLPTIFIQGVATSIDALSIGFVYLDSTIPLAMAVFGVIGAITFVLSFITTLLGKKIGKFLDDWAGLISGLVFFGVGLKILLEGILG